MPRYLIETLPPPTGSTSPEQLAAHRYPEITIQTCLIADTADSPTHLWHCLAPGETRLRQWAAAAGLQIIDLKRVLLRTGGSGP